MGKIEEVTDGGHDSLREASFCVLVNTCFDVSRNAKQEMDI